MCVCVRVHVSVCVCVCVRVRVRVRVSVCIDVVPGTGKMATVRELARCLREGEDTGLLPPLCLC